MDTTDRTRRTARASRPTALVIFATACATLLGAQLITRAGDLNPPDGPIQPTMSTLDEINDRLDLIVGNSTIVPRYPESLVWQSAATNWETLIESGDGTIESAVISNNAPVVLRDGTGTILFEFPQVGPETHQYALGFRYRNGLQAKRNSTSSALLNLIYRPDPLA